MPQAAPLSAGGWGGTTYRDGRAEPRVKRAATRSGRDGVDTRKGQDGSGGWGAARSALCARCCCALTAAVHAARRSECPQNENGRESSSTRRRRSASRGAPATIFHRRSRPCPSASMSKELCTLPLAGHSRLAGNAPRASTMQLLGGATVAEAPRLINFPSAPSWLPERRGWFSRAVCAMAASWPPALRSRWGNARGPLLCHAIDAETCVIQFAVALPDLPERRLTERSPRALPLRTNGGHPDSEALRVSAERGVNEHHHRSRRRQRTQHPRQQTSLSIATPSASRKARKSDRALRRSWVPAAAAWRKAQRNAAEAMPRGGSV